MAVDLRCITAFKASELLGQHAIEGIGNRGQDRTEQWLLKQQKLLIHSHYSLLTFTLPSELRLVARSNQRLIYDLLFKTSAAALQKLARDPRFIGGKIGTMCKNGYVRDLWTFRS